MQTTTDATTLAEQTQRSRGEVLWRALRRFVSQNPLGAAGALILILMVLMAIAAPLITPWPEHKGDFTHMSGEPNADHFFGTDQQGRDIFSRIIFGTRTTLTVAIVAVLFGTTGGALIGVVSAYAGGKVDLILQRFLEILQAFPDVILALLLLSALDPSLWTVVLAISVTRLPFGGRVIRSVALQIREMEYVTSARAIGRERLPHHVSPCRAPVRRALPHTGNRAPRRGNPNRVRAGLLRRRRSAAHRDLGATCSPSPTSPRSSPYGGWHSIPASPSPSPCSPSTSSAIRCATSLTPASATGNLPSSGRLTSTEVWRNEQVTPCARSAFAVRLPCNFQLVTSHRSDQ